MRQILLLMVALALSSLSQAQVAINSNGAAPDGSAMLDIVSTSRGVLIPRLTQAQRPSTPATGLLIYQTDNTPGFYYYSGSGWLLISTGAGSSQWTATGNDIYNANSGGVGIGTAGAPNASAILDLTSTSKGLLLPRVTSTGNISTPAAGMIVYQTGGTAGFYCYNGSSWAQLGSGGTTGNLTEATSTVLTITGGTGAVMGSGTSIQVNQATTSTSGYLSSANWNTFNGKENGLTFNAPLSRATNTISMLSATAGRNGYLSSSDWSTFNSKVSSQWNDNAVSKYLYFNTSGYKVGIGKSNPSTELDVVGAITTSGNISTGGSLTATQNITASGYVTAGGDLYTTGGNIYASGGTLSVTNDLNNNYVATLKNTHNTSSANVLKIIGGSDVGDPGANFVYFTDPTGTELGTVQQVDILTIAFNTTSDSTLKENIRNTHYNLNTLLAIKVRDFNWKRDIQKKTQTGFVAQELYLVYPDAVTKPKSDSTKWMIHKETLIPLIVKSIQDQQAQIETLKTEVSTQQATINALLQRVQALEAK